MQTEIIEVMRTQVRAIHRALTGNELPELEMATEPEAGEPQESDDSIVRRFLELEAVMRTLPAVAERVPPFSFTPPLDVIAGDETVILELAIPGIARGDVAVEAVPGGLIVTGIRRDEHAAEGRTFHAEIPTRPVSPRDPAAVPRRARAADRARIAACSEFIWLPAPRIPRRLIVVPPQENQGNDDDGHE